MEFTIIDEPFAVSFINEKSDLLIKKIAAGQLAAYKYLTVTLNKKTGLPACGYAFMCVGHYFSDGIFCRRDDLDKKAEDAPEKAEEYRFIKEYFGKYDAGRHVRSTFTEEERALDSSGGGWGGTWMGHAVPNFIDIAKYGTDGLREKVRSFAEKNPAKSDFYDAMMIYLDAVDELGQRCFEAAERAVKETDDETMRRKYGRLLKTFSYCTKKPAVTFTDACLVYIMLFTSDGTDSPGHFDQYMIDFWRNSDPEESREMLGDVWEFFHQTRTWNVCIGGTDENFNDLTNELTYEILDLTARLKYQTPNLTLRCSRNTPEEVYRAAAKAIGTGCGLPALYNDEAVCPALERIGIPPCDSHLYVMNGCNQIDVQGKSHMGLEDGEVNLGKAVELVFTDGCCSISGKKFGAETGDPSEFDTFEKFKEAYKKQVHHCCDLVCSMANKSQKALTEVYASPLRTLTIEGCLAKGMDFKAGGPLYGHGQILAEGIADAADSLAAVKKYVYDEKRFTITELAEAIRNNYEGYEAIYETLKKSPLRFGNDDPEVDSIAAEIVDDFNTYLQTIPTLRGGVYTGGCSPFSRAAGYGRGTGALPSGKKKGEPKFADSIGAEPGKDVSGPTALLKSCLRFDQTLPCSGFILNLKFDKKLFNTENGMAGFIALWKTYFANIGQQLQVTVVSRDDLLDAMVHPEDHRDLIVRVGGYSDYFVNLSRDLKENVIERTLYEL